MDEDRIIEIAQCMEEHPLLMAILGCDEDTEEASALFLNLSNTCGEVFDEIITPILNAETKKISISDALQASKEALSEACESLPDSEELSELFEFINTPNQVHEILKLFPSLRSDEVYESKKDHEVKKGPVEIKEAMVQCSTEIQLDLPDTWDIAFDNLFEPNGETTLNKRQFENRFSRLVILLWPELGTGKYSYKDGKTYDRSSSGLNSLEHIPEFGEIDQEELLHEFLNEVYQWSYDRFPSEKQNGNLKILDNPLNGQKDRIGLNIDICNHLDDDQKDLLGGMLDKIDDQDKLSGYLKAPPRYGKTVIATEFLKHFFYYLAGQKELPPRAIIIAPSQKIVDQFYEEICSFFPEMRSDVGIVYNGKNQMSKAITITTQNQVRSGVFNDLSSYGCIIYDESHKALGPEFQDAIAKNPIQPIEVAMTATTNYNDGRSVGDFFPTCFGSRSTYESIQNNRSAKVQTVIAETSEDEDTENEQIVEIYYHLFKGKKMICHCDTEERGRALEKAFKQHPYHRIQNIAYIDGKMSQDKRKKILDRFESGEDLVLINPKLLGEGYNSSAEVVCNATRRSSRIDVEQRSSRSLTPFADKECGYILECTGRKAENYLYYEQIIPRDHEEVHGEKITFGQQREKIGVTPNRLCFDDTSIGALPDGLQIAYKNEDVIKKFEQSKAKISNDDYFMLEREQRNRGVLAAVFFHIPGSIYDIAHELEIGERSTILKKLFPENGYSESVGFHEIVEKLLETIQSFRTKCEMEATEGRWSEQESDNRFAHLLSLARKPEHYLIPTQGPKVKIGRKGKSKIEMSECEIELYLQFFSVEQQEIYRRTQGIGVQKESNENIGPSIGIHPKTVGTYIARIEEKLIQISNNPIYRLIINQAFFDTTTGFSTSKILESIFVTDTTKRLDQIGVEHNLSTERVFIILNIFKSKISAREWQTLIKYSGREELSSLGKNISVQNNDMSTWLSYVRAEEEEILELYTQRSRPLDPIEKTITEKYRYQDLGGVTNSIERTLQKIELMIKDPRTRFFLLVKKHSVRDRLRIVFFGYPNKTIREIAKILGIKEKNLKRELEQYEETVGTRIFCEAEHEAGRKTSFLSEIHDKKALPVKRTLCETQKDSVTKYFTQTKCVAPEIQVANYIAENFGIRVTKETMAYLIKVCIPPSSIEENAEAPFYSYLSELYLTVVQRRDHTDITSAELAKELGVSQSVISTRYTTGKKRLQLCASEPRYKYCIGHSFTDAVYEKKQQKALDIIWSGKPVAEYCESKGEEVSQVTLDLLIFRHQIGEEKWEALIQESGNNNLFSLRATRTIDSSVHCSTEIDYWLSYIPPRQREMFLYSVGNPDEKPLGTPAIGKLMECTRETVGDNLKGIQKKMKRMLENPEMRFFVNVKQESAMELLHKTVFVHRDLTLQEVAKELGEAPFKTKRRLDSFVKQFGAELLLEAETSAEREQPLLTLSLAEQYDSPVAQEILELSASEPTEKQELLLNIFCGHPQKNISEISLALCIPKSKIMYTVLLFRGKIGEDAFTSILQKTETAIEDLFPRTDIVERDIDQNTVYSDNIEFWLSYLSKKKREIVRRYREIGEHDSKISILRLANEMEMNDGTLKSIIILAENQIESMITDPRRRFFIEFQEEQYRPETTEKMVETFFELDGDLMTTATAIQENHNLVKTGSVTIRHPLQRLYHCIGASGFLEIERVAKRSTSLLPEIEASLK